MAAKSGGQARGNGRGGRIHARQFSLYVIIGRGVYSRAANLTTNLERLASPVFIGEPTSMTGNNYGDESQLTLPYSGIWAGVASLKWQLGYPYDLRRSVVPQVPVVMTASDYFAGRDPALETAKALSVRNNRDRSSPWFRCA
jgi:hypothetical protein